MHYGSLPPVLFVHAGVSNWIWRIGLGRRESPNSSRRLRLMKLRSSSNLRLRLTFQHHIVSLPTGEVVSSRQEKTLHDTSTKAAERVLDPDAGQQRHL